MTGVQTCALPIYTNPHKHKQTPLVSLIILHVVINKGKYKMISITGKEKTLAFRKLFLLNALRTEIDTGRRLTNKVPSAYSIIKKEYKHQCGTPYFVDAESGHTICGFRDKVSALMQKFSERMTELRRPAAITLCAITCRRLLTIWSVSIAARCRHQRPQVQITGLWCGVRPRNIMMSI